MKTKTAASLLCILGLLATSCNTMTPTPSKTPPPGSGITLSDFKLTGDLGGDVAAFTLTANAMVGDAKGGSLELLSGPVALTSLDPKQKWQLTMEQSPPVAVTFSQQLFGASPMQPSVVGQHRFVAKFDHSGTYPIEVHFNAAVTQSNDWSAVGFHVATSAVQPVMLQGLAEDTEFQFANAARPERTGTNFVSYLPVDGAVQFAWKKARPEAEGKLFYAVDMVSQISVSPGLMRQAALLNGKIMQGEMNKLVLRLRGAGDITRIQGDGVLWMDDEFRRRRRTRDHRPIQPAAEGRVCGSGADADAARRVPAIAGGFAGAAGRRDAVRRRVPHCERRRGAAGSHAGERPLADFTGPISRIEPVPRDGQPAFCLPVFPARILRSRFRRTRFCRRSASPKCSPTISA